MLTALSYIAIFGGILAVWTAAIACAAYAHKNEGDES